MPPKIPTISELLKALQSSSAPRVTKPVAPPVNIQRRALLGLPETPAVAKPAQLPAVAPIKEIIEAPMSKRDFLKTTARAAGNAALRGALPELGKLAESPLTEAAKDIGKKVIDPHSEIWDVLKDTLHERINNASVDDAFPYAYETLRNKIPAENLPKNLLLQTPDETRPLRKEYLL